MDAKKCAVLRLGLISYEPAWRLQDCLAEKIAQGEHLPALLLCEHPHTYTFGRRGSEANLLWDADELARRGVAVHWVDRGGDVTYHGPGQLVGYPLLPLGRPEVPPTQNSERSAPADAHIPRADYVGYIRRLESMLILALLKLGIVSGQIPGLTGVWVQPDVLSRCPVCPPHLRQRAAKIAAIGVKVDAHGVTRHGFALNVSPDMSYWEGIVPCGLKDHPAVSLADLLDPPPDMPRVIQAVIEAFGATFDFEMIASGMDPALDSCAEPSV